MEKRNPRFTLFLPIFFPVFPFAILLVFPFFLHAQETAVLRLYHIEGNEITLTIAGQGQVYSEYAFPDGGIALAPGGIVMTGRDSAAELQLLPEGGEAGAMDEYTEQAERAGPLVKLTEGSTLRFVSFTDKTATLEILYGQLRAVSGGTADYEDKIKLMIRAGNAAMDVSGGDFNVDYMIHPGESLIEKGRNGSLRLQVYSFRGATDIVLSGNNSAASFAVNEYERVAIEAGSTRSVIERKPLDPAILAFWESAPFTGESPGIAPDTTLPGRGSRLVMGENGEERYVVFPIIDGESAALVSSRPAAAAEETPLPPSGDQRKKLALKNAFLIAGTVLSGIGLGANLYGMYGSGPPAEIAANYGYVPLGLGVVSLIVACIINPKIP
ncbi:MAG: hypothetical protein LBF77_10785 [Spirochaetaceae bacterium]|jgi:hypothetical protein|nr:hypothetical protein [Spirochaetaceae bacterium]